MGLATLGIHAFRIDPDSISWTVEIKSAYHDTIGGRVVQVYGAEFGDMTVTGQFGSGGFEEQKRMLFDMVAMAKRQPLEPLHFTYPPKGWDFTVEILSVSGNAQASITDRPGIFPAWRLRLTIVNDNLELKKVAIDAYLNRISQGLGWKASSFNGPLDWDEVQKTLTNEGVSTIHELIRKRTSDGAGPGATSGDTSSNATPGGPVPPGIPPGPYRPHVKRDSAGKGRTNNEPDVLINDVDLAKLILTTIPKGEGAVTAWAICKQRESGGVINAVGYDGGPYFGVGVGLWQITSKEWVNGGTYKGATLEQAMEPAWQIKTFAEMSNNGTSFVPWQMSGNYSSADGSHVVGLNMQAATEFFRSNGLL